ncbi:MAG: hypothetical protein LBU44_03055 [Mediterranea sp.]|jgi:hypothetical protein|nr:hypothetical protein [Mediterranea sp.]
MEDIFKTILIFGLIIFAVVRKLISSGKEREKRQHQPAQPKNDEEWDDYYPLPTLSVGTTKQQTVKKQTVKKQVRQPEPPPSLPVAEEPNEGREFDIRSTEEVRRAIVWSEILNRKY